MSAAKRHQTSQTMTSGFMPHLVPDEPKRMEVQWCVTPSR